MKKKIYIFGAGYVGLSNGVLLAQNNDVVMVDINKKRVEQINSRSSPIRDAEFEPILSSGKLNLSAVALAGKDIKTSDFVIVATPTNFDEKTGKFDTSSIEAVLTQLDYYGFKGIIVIRSTVPVGYTKSLQNKGWSKVLFVPEFLREGAALHDTFNPSRVVIGVTEFENADKEGRFFARLLLEGAQKKEVPVLLMDSTEAESVKLFSNAYLALRVSFFNELDSFALSKNLSSQKIITAVGLDPRIGNYYQNPSFGYGGYCLPKDAKQLLSSYVGVPQAIMSAIVASNNIRKQFMVENILQRKPKTVGIFRLTMKKHSYNFRESAVFDIVKKLQQNNVEVIIYEPLLDDIIFQGNLVVREFDEFVQRSDLIIANRLDPNLPVPRDKLFTRDIFGED